MQNKFLCKIYFKYLAFFIYKLFDGEFTNDNGSKSYYTCSNLGTKKNHIQTPKPTIGFRTYPLPKLVEI